jgi:predicted kinase
MVILMMCGIPGSGKSTAAEQLSHRYLNYDDPCEIICPDLIRKEITGSESDMSQDFRVWEEAYRRIEQASILGDEYVVFDSTMYKPSSRIDFIRRVKKLNVRDESLSFILVRGDTPIDECLRRNASRERKVPEEVIRKMHKALTDNPPKDEGGFEVRYFVEDFEGTSFLVPESILASPELWGDKYKHYCVKTVGYFK